MNNFSDKKDINKIDCSIREAPSSIGEVYTEASEIRQTLDKTNEHLMSIKQNTQRIADILQAAKQVAISIAIGLIIYWVMKYIGWAS